MKMQPGSILCPICHLPPVKYDTLGNERCNGHNPRQEKPCTGLDIELALLRHKVVKLRGYGIVPITLSILWTQSAPLPDGSTVISFWVKSDKTCMLRLPMESYVKGDHILTLYAAKWGQHFFLLKDLDGQVQGFPGSEW